MADDLFHQGFGMKKKKYFCFLEHKLLFLKRRMLNMNTWHCSHTTAFIATPPSPNIHTKNQPQPSCLNSQRNMFCRTAAVNLRQTDVTKILIFLSFINSTQEVTLTL